MDEKMNIKDLSEIVSVIIRYQRNLVGPLAIDQAERVEGLKVIDRSSITVQIANANDPKDLLERLVLSYEKLFGRASVEVCKEAILEGGIRVDDERLPQVLQ